MKNHYPVPSKKWLLIVILVTMIAPALRAQLTGVKTIPGDYASFTAAINDLNTLGVGAGGVTFNVAAGYAETSLPPAITATGTATSPIVFQKSGTGANPVITAGTGTSTTVDGIIRLSGADYITFDGIDVAENAANTTATAQMEWGYALLKASATDGCQYVTIRNCSITLNRSNTASVGIYVANHTTASTTSLTVSAASGTNSYNQFYSNTISNVYLGIRIAGYAAASPYSLYDQNNSAGTSAAGNTITNYAGAGTTTYGIYGIYQNNLTVANNTISSGTGHTTTLYGIFLSTGTTSNVDIYNNTVNITSFATTSTTYGINNAMGSSGTSNTVNIYNNTVQNLNWTTATSGTFYAIYNGATCNTLNLYNNTVTNNSRPGTGTVYSIYQIASVPGTVNMYNNIVSNNSYPASGTFYGIYNNPTSTTTSSVHDNNIFSNTTGGTTYGIYSVTSTTSSIFRNNVYDLTTNGTGSSIYGIYLSSGVTVNIYRNKIYGLTTNTTTGAAYGIYTGGGTTHYITNNIIGNLSAPSTSNVNGVSGMYFSGGTNINAYYNTIYVNATSTGTDFGSSGIYASTTPTVTLNNNIVANTSTPNGTGVTAAYRRSSTTLTTFSTSSNNNLYYAGTPSATRLIYYDGTNSDQTLSSYIARVTPAETLSISENPPFASTTGSSPLFLHINGTVPTGIESGAVAITGYTDDFDATGIRTGYPLTAQVNGGGTAPDIGADEGDFSPLAVDVGVLSLLSPSTTGCYSANETVRVRIKNYSSIALDLGTTNVTVNVAVTGVNPVTFPPIVLNSGTIAGGSTLDTTVSTSYNMSSTGTYTFTASTTATGDGNASNNAMAAVTINYSAGTVSSNTPSVCIGNQATLTLTGYSGTLQWQSYDPVSMTWVNETGPGNTSANYNVSPLDTTTYRALVCGTHTSPTTTIDVINLANPVAMNAARCGAGSLTLGASGQGTLNWYDAASAGNLVNTGSTYNVNLTSTDTFYVEAIAGAPVRPLRITEADLGTNDLIEIQNMSSSVINTAGWVVAVSNSYTNINSVNTILWNLPATMQPGQVLFKTDQSSSPNYWGNNILWNPGSYPSFTGWAIIIDNNGNIVDFAAWNWQASDIQSMSTTINSFPITIGSQWTGTGISAVSANTGLSLSRQGSGDNNTAADFSVITSTIGTQNPGLNYPFGCSSPSRTPVVGTINYQPVVNLGNDTVFCQGGAAALNAGNPGNNYAWSTGATTQTISAATSGTYSVNVSTTAGCTAQDTVMILVNPAPVVNIGPDVTQCEGTVLLDANNPGPLFAWSNGGTAQTVTVNATGTYSVVVTDGNGCQGRDTVLVTINTNPVVNLGPDTSFCAGSTIMLNAGNTGMSYAWSEGSTSQTIAVNTADTFAVTVTNPSTGCSNIDTVVTSLDAVPVVNLGADITQCGGSVTLNAGNAGSSYSWSNASTSQTNVVSTSGAYSVMVTNPAGCANSDTINITINPVPVVNLGADITQCGGTVTLTAGNTGSAYSWSTGATTQTVMINTTGNYSVSVLTPQGCSNSDTVLITINPLPIPNAGNDTTICAGSSVVLNGGAGYSSYTWTESSTVIGSSQTVTVTPGSTTSYELSVTDNNGCTSIGTDVVIVTVETAPAASFSASVTGGVNATFTNTTNSNLAFTSSWNFGDSSPLATTTNAAHTYTANGTYNVTLIVTSACGSDTVTQQVTITGVGIDEASMLNGVQVYPNPSDGMLYIEVKNAAANELKLTVTDMTGRVVYTASEEMKGDTKKTLDLSSMAKGVYYLRMETGNKAEVRRIVIQ